MKSAKWTLLEAVGRVLVGSRMTNALFRLRRHAAALLPALALGCAHGGQTGEETTGACEETRQALAPGERSPLGFGADEVLATASATSAGLEWLSTDPAYGPESGASELTLSLDALGTATFVKSRTLDGREEYPCADRVEVDVATTLATSGGALDEAFEGTLRSTSAKRAELSQVFENGDVGGALSFDEESLAGRTILRVTLDASFGGGAVSGVVSAGVEQRFGGDENGTASFRDMVIACFGEPTAGCPQP